ncbi:MAG TPA: hypothetical protein DEG17_24460 [Cyanobacteria bacterium UBA11149]|nr:hypothetical protein [Cyanobacteria bacterium UBA11367]HBE55985.1 hypothetical protein [Cyanobacteria bacterium UBA11366]HBK63213.1 hypothetical protein [Cyanobacteria bacterium UBA11166]HBR74551.1 hypothetical protein [Cyanobacteria bacterium UBA11159]HBW91932.1 hypothetical protein [Cyanobacteria bacterium UBA11149]
MAGRRILIDYCDPTAVTPRGPAKHCDINIRVKNKGYRRNASPLHRNVLDDGDCWAIGNGF